MTWTALLSGVQPNGSGSSANNSPPTSPATPAILRLPYALISPDLYSHSDGVLRNHPSRHELLLQYSPSFHQPPPSKFIRGRFLRTYRWGTLDVLDPVHSDFVPLRNAIFHHMETLQKYTREYLFDKFKDLTYQQQRPTSRHSLPHPRHLSQGLHLGRLPHSSRPILAIDTASSHASAVTRHPSLHIPRELAGADYRVAPVPSRPIPDTLSSSISSKNAGSRSTKQRSKKITVACNFCRSRKLKCDGGRPACAQCVKRSNPCDYQVQNKRRGTARPSKSNDSGESDSATEDRSQDHDALYSPDGPSRPMSHRSSILESYTPSIAADEPSSSSSRKPSLVESRPYFHDNELPHIATLSLPSPSPSTPVPMSAPSLPPIRPASEQQAAQRKRAATVPGKTTRQPSMSGPKVVACNFCRARKTKCDGGHPSCSSCARRSLACNYVHDNSPNGSSVRKVSRRASTSKPPTEPSHSPTSSRMIPTPSSINGGYDPREEDIKIESDMDLKRSLDHPDVRPMKKMRMDNPPIVMGIP